MKYSILILLLFFAISGCGQDNRNVLFFKNTDAYELAKAIEREGIAKIESLAKENRSILGIPSSSGSNVLVLCIYLERFEAFKKLLELGADPNIQNPYTNYSPLIIACKPFGSSLDWSKDIRYAELLLEYGADPNFAVENEFVNEKGIRVSPTSPLIRASKLSLQLVTLLLKNGADQNKAIGVRQYKPLTAAVEARKFEIIDFYIDSMRIDVNAPLLLRKNDKLYIQDYIKKFMSFKPETESFKKKERLIGKSC